MCLGHDFYSKSLFLLAEQMYQIASLLILALGLFFIAVNWSIVYNNSFTKNKHVSWVPLMGGLFTAVGVAGSPFNDYVEGLLWVPFVVDYGCLPALIHSAWILMFRRRRNH